MPRQICGSCGVEKCPDCGHIWNNEPDDECECAVVDSRDYVTNPLTEQEKLQRELYNRAFLRRALMGLPDA